MFFLGKLFHGRTLKGVRIIRLAFDRFLFRFNNARFGKYSVVAAQHFFS